MRESITYCEIIIKYKLCICFINLSSELRDNNLRWWRPCRHFEASTVRVKMKASRQITQESNVKHLTLKISKITTREIIIDWSRHIRLWRYLVKFLNRHFKSDR